VGATLILETNSILEYLSVIRYLNLDPMARIMKKNAAKEGQMERKRWRRMLLRPDNLIPRA
jgi:hypothetical protein